MKLTSLEQSGCKAILALRQEKISRVTPFMIKVHELASNQCYFEYADGTIELVTLPSSRLNFESIRVLPYSEAAQIRKTLGLDSI